jgi:hypothetical protein
LVSKLKLGMAMKKRNKRLKQNGWRIRSDRIRTR